MKLTITNIIILFLKLILVFWLLGGLPLVFQIIFIIGVLLVLKKIINNRHDFFVEMMVVLLLIQIISLSLSFRFDFFNLERFFASYRNIANFCLIIIGYFLCSNRSFYNFFKKYSKSFFLLVCFLSLLAFAIGFIYKNDIVLGTFFSFFFDSSLFKISIVRMGWLGTLYYPRSLIFSMYPNGTALIIFTSFIIFRVLNFKIFNNKIHFYYALFILGIISTGSRIVLFFALLLYLIEFYRSYRKYLRYFLSFVVLLIFFFHSSIFDFLKDIYYSRLGSTNTRLKLYIDSVNFMIENSPIIGTGIKPRIYDIADGELPVGSHSSIIGYLVKTGFVGFLFFSSVFIYFIFKPLYHTLKIRASNFFIYFKRYFILISTSFLFIIFTLEDLDASEIVCFYTGIILYLYNYEK